MRRICLLCLILLTSRYIGIPTAAVAAERGTLRGQVVDAESGEALIGVDLALVGANEKGMTDIDGNFEIPDLRPARYDLRVTYLGYNTKFVGGIEVAAGRATQVRVALESFRAHETDDMVISAGRVLNTDSALLASRKQSVVIGDAISAAQISRSPDGTSGDALKRVPGLTVNGGKYVFVRGVTDRYNVTEVNGVSMSGTNVDKDRKSFNFDMVPANLLANVVVIKSATPDLPGDFSGGLVRITTLEFPEEATTSVGVSAAYTDGTTGQAFRYDAQQGDTDWLGRDDGGRDFPRELLSENVTQPGYGTRNQALARALPNRWTSAADTAPPRLNFNLSHGNQLDLFGGQMGYMAAASYRNKYEFSLDNEQRQVDPVAGGVELDAQGETSHMQVTWGGLANLFWRKGRQRIGFTNTYNHDGTSDITQLSGQDSSKDFAWQSLEWQERTQFVNKLDGRHRLPGPAAGFDFSWQVFYGESNAHEPDRRYLGYNTSGEVPLMDENMRTWTWLDETRRGHAFDLAWSPAADDFEKQFKPEFKVGYRRDWRGRDFDVEAWYTTPSFRTAGDLRVMAPDSIFAPEHYNEVSDPRRGAGWEFAQDDINSGIYSAEHEVKAWYAMADLPFGLWQEDLRLTGGVRVEDSDQVVVATPRRSLPDQQETATAANRDALPSVALTWFYDERTNVRLGYYKSVNRPEFRELAPVNRRNFKTFQNELGNPDLRRAVIENYDIRFEHFPDYGEVAAVSVFYKDIRDAIEDTLYMAPERAVASWSNVPQAKNWGVELELRRKLDYFSFTENITASANYTRVWSEVPYIDPTDDQEHLRTMHGQAPWSINAGLSWDPDGGRTNVSLLYNKVGRRLDKIADFRFLYVYLEPRNKLDLVVTRKLGSHYRLKAAAKDILAEDTVLTSGSDENPYEYSRYSEGTEYSLSLSGRF